VEVPPIDGDAAPVGALVPIGCVATETLVPWLDTLPVSSALPGSTAWKKNAFNSILNLTISKFFPV
jgi:hypothetical protein